MAAGSSGSEDENNNAPAAWNASIYLMVGMPYTLLVGVGFLIYRGVKKNTEYLQTDNKPES